MFSGKIENVSFTEPLFFWTPTTTTTKWLYFYNNSDVPIKIKNKTLNE